MVRVPCTHGQGRSHPHRRLRQAHRSLPRFLRKLDDRGLLSPVTVDPDSGYRYYSLEQTQLAGLIHLGRQMGLTVGQLHDLVEAHDSGRLHPYLERQRAAVAVRLAEQGRLLRLLDQELSRGGLPLAYEIALKEMPPLLVMSGAASLRRSHPHDPWALESALRKVGARVMVHIARQGEEPSRHPIVLYDTDLARDEEIAFEVCLPVPRELPRGPGVECKLLPAALVASTTFRGPYDTIWNAYVELRHGSRSAATRSSDRCARPGWSTTPTPTTRVSG